MHALDVISYSGDATATAAVRLHLHVSSGTYVRSIAEALGGHCTSLRRTAVGPFVGRGGPTRSTRRSSCPVAATLESASRGGARAGPGERAGRGARAVNVARQASELEPAARAVAVGTFDGVHLGHRAVIGAAVDAGLRPTVVTFDPHPRTVLGNRVELLATLERRLELLEACGVEDVLVVEFTPEVAAEAPEEFARENLLGIGAEVVVAGEGFRFGRRREGTLELLRELGLDARQVPLVAGISSSRIRQYAHAGELAGAARLLGRPLEVEGIVVSGDQRGGTLGFPTANLSVDPDLLVPGYGIYAGAVGDRRAAISIGVNPHYGGTERRVEAFLLDWEGDLYGRRLVVELWQRLRDERAFASEADLIAQIARDVEATRRAERPA